jgi:hypothetical protein
MKRLRLLFFLLVAGVSFGVSQNCQTASAVPDGQLKLASGRVILDNDGVASISGGQAVYAKITNESRAKLSYWFSVEVLKEDTKSYATTCLYRATLAPKTSAVVWGSSSAAPPIPWRVSVTIGPESDGDERIAGLSYEIYSSPSKNDSHKE